MSIHLQEHTMETWALGNVVFSFEFWNHWYGKDDMAAKALLDIYVQENKGWERKMSTTVNKTQKYDTTMSFWVETCHILSNSATIY